MKAHRWTLTEVTMSNRFTRRMMWAVAVTAVAAPAAAQQTVQLPAKDNVLKERPADVFTVGTVEGRDWEMFSGIRAVAFDGADNMYLLDGQNTRIVVFDANGRFVRQFGRKGGGPGELETPLSMGLTADGSLVVSDLGNRSFVVFTTEGEYVRNVPFADELGFPTAMAIDRRGGIIARSMQRPRPGQAPADAAFSPIFRQPLDGADAQTLVRVPVAAPRVIESGGGRVAAMRMEPIFGPSPSFGVLPAGLALHHETEYAIRILDDAGRPVRVLARAYKPRKVTKKDQEKWQEQRRRDQEAGAGPAVIMTRSTPAGSTTSIGSGAPRSTSFTLEDMPFAEFMSVVTSIRTDPQGRIWVQRRNADGAARGPIDLVDANGRYIGTLPAQPLPNAVSASGLAAWVTTDDELGVERVTVRRLPAGWR
jgi:hypothetical protein